MGNLTARQRVCALRAIMSDPIYALLAAIAYGKNDEDVWGTEIAWPEGQHAPCRTSQNEKRC
jgi:hypothetical protein